MLSSVERWTMRRRAGSGILFRGVLAIAALAVMGMTGQAQNAVDVKPSPQQTQWQDLEFGVILHFGTNTFLDREWGDGTADPKVFNPCQFDPAQWLKAIQAPGATYLLLPAEHLTPLCL